MGARDLTLQAPDGQGGQRDMSIRFTEVSVRLDKIHAIEGDSSKCQINSENEVRKYGLCEDINIYKGDYIHSNSQAWNYYGRCLSEVDVVKREHKE